MDKYIRDLSIGGDNLEIAVEQCFKILQFLKLTRHTELTYPEVEIIVKACVYLKETSIIYGNKLVSQLQDHCKFYASDAFYSACLDAMMHKDICEFILRFLFDTKNGYKHILNVENLFGQLRKANLDYKLGTPNANSAWEAVPKERERLLLILQRLFQIPVAQVDDAIARIIEAVPFDIIGHTFLDLERYMYADLCAIFEQKICERLENNGIAQFFIDSMYYGVSHSDRGSQLYWKCLKSCAFANSLCKFFVNYLGTIVVTNHADQQQFRCDNVECRVYNFAHVIYLIHTALDMRSPCRSALYHMIHKQSIDKCLRNYINKLVFVYD